MADSLSAALDLAKRGLRVFPLIEGGRTPAFAGWPETASADIAIVERWFAGEYRKANIGVATGDGLMVVDADAKRGQDGLASLDLMAMLGADLDFVVATPSGGRHAYFRLPADTQVSNSVHRLAEYPDIDIRGERGFVVAPGSAVANGRYEIMHAGRIPPAPQWLVEAAQRARKVRDRTAPVSADLDKPEAIERAKAWLDTNAPAAIEGAGGNDTAYRVAAHIKDFGVSEITANELMAAPNGWNDRCSPPWDPVELEQVIEHAFAYGTSSPGAKSADAEFDAVEIVDSKPKDMLPVVDPATLLGEPPARTWIAPGAVPQGEVTLLYGDGGLGKTLLAQQLATAMVANRPWLGFDVQPGKVLAIFCEDDTDELWRRQNAINKALGVDRLDPAAFLWASADQVSGMGGMMMTFADGGEGKLTKFYRALEQRIAAFRPDLVIIDPLANVYGGKEQDRGQVTYFVNRALKSLCVKYTTTVLALAHPSLAGMETGRGSSGSTAWNNAVRSRLYLSKPTNDPSGDYRQLDGMKSNYGRTGHLATLRWRQGAFMPVTAGEDEPERVAERALLAAMRVLTERGTVLSPAPRVGNYVVRLAMSLPETRGLGRSDLEQALERLLRAGNVAVDKQPDDKRRLRDTLKIVFDPDRFASADDDLEA